MEFGKRVFSFSYLRRILTEEEHKSALAKLTSELEDCRMSENKLLQENSSRCNKILLLQQQLKETTENLQQSWKKLDSLGEQYEDTFQQQNKIMVGLFASPSSIAGSLRVINRPRGSIWKFQIKNNNMHN